MATHEHWVKGKQWICLTSIDSDEDRDLLRRGGDLYNSLFFEEEKEPWEHFEKYVSDSADARRRPKQADVIDTLSFAFEGAELKGLLFFSWYPKLALVFNPYLGFLRSSKLFIKTVPEIIGQERIKVGLPGRQTEAVLFELDKFDPEALGFLKSRVPPHLSAAFERAQLTRVYQEGGAWLIPWVDYKQPPLEKGSRTLPFHLMYWPVDPRRHSDPGTFSKQDVARFVRFTYEQFYLDGFRSTEPDEDWPYWEAQMKQLSNEALLYVPDTPMRMEKIAAKEAIGKTFVSYAGADVANAELIAWRLKTRGSPVILWEIDKKGQGGRRIGETVHSWLDSASYFVFLITSHSFASSGQKDEIDRVLRKPDARMQIITNVEHNDLEAYFGFPVSGSRGIIYHHFVDKRNFAAAVDTCVQSIVSWGG